MRLLLAAALLLVADVAAANDVAIALTDDLIDIDAGFSGAKIVLFGVVTSDEPGAFPQHEFDIAAIVRGPATTFRMRPFEQRRLIWTPGPALDIEAPGVTLTLSTRPLPEIADPPLLDSLMLITSAERLADDVNPQSPRARARLAALGAPQVAAAFLAEARRRRLIVDSAGVVDFRKAGLFAIEVALPPTTPIGDYTAEVFLFRNRQLVSRDLASLSVRKVGIESAFYEFAHRRPLAYGVACVAFSVVAGLLAAAAFRRS
ncbi:MAG: TIGR02186 family protein [Parvularculaceae bacterium]|nr:TIGR02186 family protein [Parvularculaceae bacterium]